MRIELSRIHRIKTDNRLTVSFEIPDTCEGEYAALVEKGQPNDLYDVTISTLRRKRTTGWKSQNHAVNGFCMQIANYTGEDFPSVKLYVKRQAIKRGVPIKTNTNGDILYSRFDGEPIPISESDMTTEQCSWCTEEARILASELGIILQE